jgi:hypothetical protein
MAIVNEVLSNKWLRAELVLQMILVNADELQIKMAQGANPAKVVNWPVTMCMSILLMFAFYTRRGTHLSTTSP